MKSLDFEDLQYVSPAFLNLMNTRFTQMDITTRRWHCGDGIALIVRRSLDWNSCRDSMAPRTAWQEGRTAIPTS